MILVISGIIIVFGVVLIIGGVANNFNVAFPIGLVIVFFSLFLGFGILGNVVSVETKTEIITPIELVKGETTIFAKIDGKTFETTEHKFFSIDLKNLKVRRSIDINSYGVEIQNTTSPKYEWFIEGNLEKAE